MARERFEALEASDAAVEAQARRLREIAAEAEATAIEDSEDESAGSEWERLEQMEQDTAAAESLINDQTGDQAADDEEGEAGTHAHHLVVLALPLDRSVPVHLHKRERAHAGP